MAGTIATQLGDVSTASYDPERLKLEDEQDTVEGRIARIIASNSKLNTAVRSNVQDQYNARGLSKSALAVSAGESAVINNAIPIATTDANNSIQAKMANQNAGNAALQFGATGLQNLTSLNTQTAAQSRLQAEKADIDLRLQSADAELRQQLMNRQGEIDREMQQLRGTQDIANIQAQGDVNRENTAAEIAARTESESRLTQERGAIDLQNQQAMAATNYLNDRAMQELKGDQQQALTEMDAQYRLLAQTSNSAAGFYAQISESISTILASDIPSTQKQGLVDQQMNLLKGGLTIIGGAANVDLLGLLNPAATGPAATPGAGVPNTNADGTPVATPIAAPPAFSNLTIQQIQDAIARATAGTA